MVRRVTLLRMKAGARPEDVTSFLDAIRAIPSNAAGVARVGVGPAKTRSAEAWTHMWDMEFSRDDAADGYARDPWVRANVAPAQSAVTDALELLDFDVAWSGVKPDSARTPVRRAMLIQMSETATPEQIARTEDLIEEMPQRIPDIKGWALGRARRGSVGGKWTHVRDHEFLDFAAVDAYTKHPFHADVVAAHFAEMRRVGAMPHVTAGWYAAPESFIRPV